jgi:hypothetical protein
MVARPVELALLPPMNMRHGLLALLLAPALAAAAAAAETILVIGDSHSAGSFGQNLDDVLRRTAGNRVATYGVCSARPQSYLSETPHSCGYLFRDFDKKPPAKWLGGRVYKATVSDGKGGTREVTMVKTPSLAQLLTDHVPTLTVVELGANLPLSEESIKKTLELIHKNNSACVWIGPPNMRNPTPAQVDSVYAILRKNKVTAGVSLEDARKDSCLLIDSLSFAYLRYPATGGDGTHYGGALSSLGAKWGADAATAVLDAFKP